MIINHASACVLCLRTWSLSWKQLPFSTRSAIEQLEDDMLSQWWWCCHNDDDVVIMMMVSYNNDDDVVCSHYDDGDDFSVDGDDDGNERVQYDLTQRELRWGYRSAVCPKEERGCPLEFELILMMHVVLMMMIHYVSRFFALDWEVFCCDTLRRSKMKPPRTFSKLLIDSPRLPSLGFASLFLAPQLL